MSKTLIKHKYYSFELYEGRSILKLDWTEDSAGMTDEDFKDCLLKYAKLAEEHRIKKLWVSQSDIDTRSLLSLWLGVRIQLSQCFKPLE